MICVLVMAVRTGTPASIIDEVGLSVSFLRILIVDVHQALQTPTSDRPQDALARAPSRATHLRIVQQTRIRHQCLERLVRGTPRLPASY